MFYAFGIRGPMSGDGDPVPAVAEDTDLRRLAQVLLDTGLPVTDDVGHLSGFVSRTDIWRAVTSDPPLDVWS